MRFERIRIDAFGGVKGLDTGDDPLGGLVVVEGRNEAGKSTFFEWIASLLYGFRPATRDAHPYSPWDGTSAEGSAVVRTADGAEFEVRRRLLSSPTGSVERDGISEDLRNRTLPVADHVSDAIYRQVFALRLSELARLEGREWEAVQDRLLSAFGAGDVRPTRDVVAELEAEAGALWRTTARGNQEIRDLEAKRKELLAARGEALGQEREIRDTFDRLAQARARLEAARDERTEARAFIERYRSLGPIREQLQRIEGYRDDAGDPALLDALPADPAEALAALSAERDEIASKIARLERDMEDPAREVTAFDVHARTVLARESELNAFLRRASQAEQTRLVRAQREQDSRDLHRRLETGVLNALGRPWDDELAGPIMNVPIPKLREALERYRTHEKPGAEEVVPEGLIAEVRMGVVPIGAVVLFGVGLIAIIVAFLVNHPWWLLLPGSVLAGIGANRMWSHHQAYTADERRRTDLEERRRRAEATRQTRESALAEARTELEKWLAPLIDDFTPGDLFPELPSEINRFQELIRDDWARREEIETCSRELGRLEEEAAELALLDSNLSSDAVGLAHDLPGLIRSASSLREAAAAAEREIAGLRSRIEEARDRHAEVVARIEDLQGRLARLGDGDLEVGRIRAAERLEARRRADQLLDELERQHHDLPEIRERIAAAEAAGEDWTVDPEAVARERGREETLTDEIEDLKGEVHGLEAKVEHLGGRTLVDEMDGRLAALDDRRARLVRERDRLWVMGRVIQEAERRLREEHQPTILRDAGRMLERLTGGRYERVLLGDRDGRGFRVRGPATPDALPVEEPLSTGTREQIYLALRLAILDHLDRGGDRLPLVLDEILVNWDPGRRAAGIELLAEVARTRQVFFFTCHPDIANEVAAVASRRIRLELETPDA